MSDEEIKEDNIDKGDEVDKGYKGDKEVEYLAGWKRALADYDNLKKDLARERGDMRASAIADAAMRVIPVLDNFDVATKFQPKADPPLADAPEWRQLQNWVTGILFIQTQLDAALKDMGVEPYGAVDDPFDANLHDAVGERPSDSPPANHRLSGVPQMREEGSGVVAPRIAEIVSRGWKLGDRIVRPAKVVVTNA